MSQCTFTEKITCLYACVCAYYHARFKLSLIKYIIGTTFVIVACPTCYCMKSDIESLFVQRTNKISIHCSFSFPMKGLFEKRLSNHIFAVLSWTKLIYNSSAGLLNIEFLHTQTVWNNALLSIKEFMEHFIF